MEALLVAELELIEFPTLDKIWEKEALSKDFCWRPCNCTLASKINRLCTFNGECQVECIVHRVVCCCCGYEHVGVTQQAFKD
eukprot:10000821-Ditylum_brightwellii.AAC.1